MVAALLASASVIAACDPADGLGSSAVSVTTDQLATHALKADNVKVQWLSCSARTGTKRASVDCVGRTDDQQKISVKGTVTEQLDNTCVRGRLTATVGTRRVFDVQGLGNCGKRTPAGS
ncbi:hypothetical protein [Actinacidiphila bryophytorum]|uniref:Uncharacterized protein n=1 Tax=Actinacidiphila bryophytorum TaxID=1436133 RepID=A0A9W4E9P7_9ACTN|nr:hypothetical protein [Actinacidiphila bryophytorum]MBM9434580.1 hypothetical protein [Actinacidiphila bryophytorum]MBN6543279.1 hypothetical protein [Actinacidiphila bryophytorum]CAG7627722.1 conserved hypothetical protein [Actinacidiphila bryophytorum]